MDKFTRIFQASLGNKLTKLEEANGTEKPTAKGGYRALFGKITPAEHIYKNGVHARAGAGKYAKLSHAGGMIVPTDFGATALSLDALDKTAKGYLGVGGSIAKGKKQGTASMKAAIKRGAIGNAVSSALLGAAIRGKKGAAVGAAHGAVFGAGEHALNQKGGELWYRRKARKVGVAESVLEEVKGRIAAKKLEEGIGSTVAGLLAKVRGLKPIKKAGNVVKDLKDAAGVIGPRYKLYKAIGKTKFRALKANAGAVGRGIAGTAKTNPYGAALVGGGTLGVGGLTAWGLKRPKKSIYEGAPFDFSKLKDKKGKDKGKGGGKVPPQFAKGKDKGGDSQKDSEVNPAQEALAKAKGKAKKKGGKKGLPPEFLKNIKGGDKGTPPVAGDKKSLPDFLKKKGRQ